MANFFLNNLLNFSKCSKYQRMQNYSTVSFVVENFSDKLPNTRYKYILNVFLYKRDFSFVEYNTTNNSKCEKCTHLKTFTCCLLSQEHYYYYKYTLLLNTSKHRRRTTNQTIERGLTNKILSIMQYSSYPVG